MTASKPNTQRAGVVVVDKPPGLTSHDVVQRVRRMLGMRRVGHAGTLDPMATGVLVVMLGPATKLAPYLTQHHKSYLAMVSLGRATTTLDAEGETTAEATLPSWWADSARAREALDEHLAAERTRLTQLPPVFSAIKVAGRAAHARTRAGETVELAPRPVQVQSLELGSVGGGDGGLVELSLTVSKGYYVRSLARDLGERLGLPAHLCALRRTASGPFEERDAVALEPAPLEHAIMGMDDAARLALASVTLTEAGTYRATRGQALEPSDFTTPVPADEPSAWFDPTGHLVAIGELRPDGRPVLRRGGFRAQ